jgi:excisionase family DNA binding protein
MIDRGDLPVVRFGRAVRVPRQAVVALATRGMATATR